ncbi:hypothetical protein HG535_0D00120 [Zygotorulaspora mrakii]|uniref:Major facilitator superfamily (MFS) profile domain-containing protein n=1 Tax=Zygotorulaspora mrakii TaxID=42260 RepID=A0A7H9B1E6_ZYGMR|nr:uncharacterized protein HG535_0D00120 [Zygotorulaspora mrakii]QLG72307.1 hypothetical protein HG535_0D00120 [Zygotorulaspora mrakii]
MKNGFIVTDMSVNKEDGSKFEKVLTGATTSQLEYSSFNELDSSSIDAFNDSKFQEDNGNPFLNPIVEKHYRELYVSTKYECVERFDPFFTWTKKEEKKVVNKLDWHVTLLSCFLFVALQVDRGNLLQGVADNLLHDLGLNSSNYNVGNTIFFLTFLCAELPSQLISKKIGADNWIPMQMTAWALVATLQCRMKGKNSFYACRALLGLLEGGFVPDLVLWMSYFYNSSELSIRLSFFWVTLSLTQIVTSFVAYGVFHMRGIGGMAGWQWLFLIEGIFTLFIGVSAYFLMVPSVVQTKKPWNKKGWFTEREEKIIVNKILRDDPTKGDMNNRQGMSLKMLWKALTDYYLWPIYLIGLVAYIPTNVLTTYLTMVLRNIGFTTFEVNLLAIPSFILHIILLLGLTWLTEKCNNRLGLSLLQPLYTVPLLAVLRFWKATMFNKWGTYAIITLLLGNPYIHAICVSLCSRNSQSVKTRTVSTSLYNMFVQAGLIISSNVYAIKDAPIYRRGNAVLFGLALAMFPILIGSKFLYVYINKQRDKTWDCMSEEERDHYLNTTTEVGSRRLDFRFYH